MINQPKVVEVFEESIVDDDIIVIIDDRHYDIDDSDSNIDDEWIECMDCVQRKMICIISILIIGTILLIFAYTINT
tara:strand:- start:191 stop:418 length:228 start_codon:yes stop_codon:yes gene_type:complete